MTKKQISDMLHSLYAAGEFPLEKREAVKANRGKKGFTLGQICARYAGYRVSKDTRTFSVLTKTINSWARKYHPSLEYTSIHVNEGVAPLHIDSNNSGPSLIIAFGKFTGGRLWTWEEKNNLIDVRKAYVFDGNQPHMNEPIQSGLRFSIVFFNNRGGSKTMPPGEMGFYRKMGFRRASRKDPATKTKVTLETAARFVRKRFGFRVVMRRK